MPGTEFETHAQNVQYTYNALAVQPISTSSDDILKAINANLAEINLINNLSNISNNVNQEILVKKNQLLKMKNDTLMAQLREIEGIESIISNKNTMIEETNLNILNQDRMIYMLIISLILAIILFLVIIIHGYGKINNKILVIIICLIIIIYVLILMYGYNIFYFRDAITYFFFDRSRYRLGSALEKWSETIKTDIKNNIYGDKTQWIDNHCACSNTVEEEDTLIYPTNGNITETEIPGYFEYDGSAPPQLLVPTPRQTPTLSLNESIDWVDYSSNGKNRYNLNNINNINNRLPNELVNSETLTANM